VAALRRLASLDKSTIVDTFTNIDMKGVVMFGLFKRRVKI